MEKKVLYAMVIFFSAIQFTRVNAQEELKPWEKFGLSQTEWKMVRENNISEKKLEVILRTGISVSEYIKKPWEPLSMSENTWIEKRRAGLTSYDIEIDAKTTHAGFMRENQSTFGSEMQNFYANKELLKAIVLPGYQQFRLGHSTRGKVMAGIAAVALVSTVVWTISTSGAVHFEPIIVFLIPDMFWSGIDFKVSLGKMEK